MMIINISNIDYDNFRDNKYKGRQRKKKCDNGTYSDNDGNKDDNSRMKMRNYYNNNDKYNS